MSTIFKVTNKVTNETGFFNSLSTANKWCVPQNLAEIFYDKRKIAGFLRRKRANFLIVEPQQID